MLYNLLHFSYWENAAFFWFPNRYNMPRIPLSELRPKKFPKIGDEEFAFDSYDEDTDEETADGDTSEIDTYTVPEAETPEVKIVNLFDKKNKRIRVEEEVETDVWKEKKNNPTNWTLWKYNYLWNVLMCGQITQTFYHLSLEV